MVLLSLDYFCYKDCFFEDFQVVETLCQHLLKVIAL